MVATIARAIISRGKRSDRLTVEAIPRTVAITPGPTMIGMANGMKATFSWIASLPPLGIIALAGEGAKSSKPKRIRIMPPTMRTMLSGTPKRRMIRVPKVRKKNIRRVA
jgi:hypothetical protein